MNAAPDHFVKVRFMTEGEKPETVWAEPVGEHFRLDNMPFIAFGVSDDDLVEATPLRSGLYDFVRVVKPSGNRLVRVIFEDSDGQSLMGQLQVMGCSYEGANRRYYAVSIPPQVSLQDVANVLITAKVIWEHANPTYEDLHSD